MYANCVHIWKKKIVQNMLTSFSANVREACATSEQYDNEKKSIK